MTYAKLVTVSADVVAGVAVVGSLVGYLPAIASGVATIYYTVMIYLALAKRKDND